MQSFLPGLTISPAAAILRVLLEDPAQPRYGGEIAVATGLRSGTLYPLLRRIEEAGWLESWREDINPSEEGRPARKFYTLTAQGADLARTQLAELSDRLRPPAAGGVASWLPS